jgi:alpha-amylase
MKSAFLLSLAAAALAATPAQWRSQSVYFLLTDRFARTDNSTTAECDTSVRVSLRNHSNNQLTRR